MAVSEVLSVWVSNRIGSYDLRFCSYIVSQAYVDLNYCELPVCVFLSITEPSLVAPALHLKFDINLQNVNTTFSKFHSGCNVDLCSFSLPSWHQISQKKAKNKHAWSWK